MGILPAALAGMEQAQAGVERAASRIAACGTPEGDRVDLSAEMVSLMEARSGFEADTRLVRVAEDVGRRLVDMLG